MASALLAAMGAQSLIEGFRWQLFPLYGVAVGLAVGDVLFLTREVEWSNRVVRGLFGSLGVGLASVFAFVLPVPEMPVPTGPESIGTASFELADTDRPETYGDRAGRSRRFVVQAYYPALLPEGSEPSAWAEDWQTVAPAMARNVGLPSWFLNHTGYTDSNAYPTGVISPGSYPVVIYSHGWTGSRSIAPNQLETLASNGYLVISIDHTYIAVATEIDGEIVEFEPSALPDIEEVGEEEYAAASASLVEVMAGDIVHLIDVLELGEEGSMAGIAEYADLTRLGVFGHSAGGGAAIKVCLEDERCDAVLGMDPWVEPLPDSVLKISPMRPSLYMRSDEWRGTPNDQILRGLADRNESTSYWVGVSGTAHNDFTAAPLLSPVSGIFGFRGSIPAGRIIPIIDNYLLGFFDVFLLGTGSAALDRVVFEEVAVEVIGDG